MISVEGARQCAWIIEPARDGNRLGCLGSTQCGVGFTAARTSDPRQQLRAQRRIGRADRLERVRQELDKNGVGTGTNPRFRESSGA